MNNIKKQGIWIFTFFFISVYILPFISFPFILSANKGGKELYQIATTAIWTMYFAIANFKKKKIYLDNSDKLLSFFILYALINYASFSFYGKYYTELWVFISYSALFFIHKNIIRVTLNSGLNNILTEFIFPVVILVTCILEAILALLQKLKIYDTNNNFFEITGTFINPNFLAVQITVGLLICFDFLQSSRINKKIAYTLILLLLYILIISGSRTAFIGLFSGTVALLFNLEKEKIRFLQKRSIFLVTTIFLLIILGTFGLSFSKGTDSLKGRILVQKIALPRILDHALLGNGQFNFAGVYNEDKANYFNTVARNWEEIRVGDYVTTLLNDYLQITFDMGLLGLILITLLVIYIIGHAKITKSNRIYFAITISMLTMSIFTSVIYNPCAMIILVACLSILSSSNSTKSTIIFSPYINRIIMCLSLLTICLTIAKTVALVKFHDEIGENSTYTELNIKNFRYIIDDPFVEFKVGYSIFQHGQQQSGLSMMENSVKKTMIPDANVALANLYSGKGDYSRSEELLKINEGIEPNRFKPKFNLMLFYKHTGERVKMLQIAKKIINFPVKIKSTEVSFYKEEAKKIINQSKSSNKRGNVSD